MSFLLRLTTSKGSEHILVACLQTLWGLQWFFPSNLRFLWGKGDQELYQWDHRGEVSGKGPMSPGGTVTETLRVAKSSPLCQLLLFFKPLENLVPVYRCSGSPASSLNIYYEAHRKSWQKARVTSWATEMLSKSSASATLQQVCPGEGSLFANSWAVKPKFLGEISFQSSHFRSLCNSLWTEASRTKAIPRLNSLQDWLTESHFQWWWGVGILQVKLPWATFIPLNSRSVPTSVFDLTSLWLQCKSLWMYE